MMAVGEGAPIEDPSTGLFSEAFLRAVLPTRIATARRSLKQLGLVMVDVDRAVRRRGVRRGGHHSAAPAPGTRSMRGCSV